MNSDLNVILHNSLIKEFAEEYLESRLDWRDFIYKKDLGLLCTGDYSLDYTYSIIDEKKWNYNKIKLEL